MPAPAAHTNYIRHLNAFFVQVRKETRLQANHVSLYLALFQVWNYHRFQNPFPILREEVMSLSCIGSRSTYVRCLKHLDYCRYIIYVQARQAYAASYVSIIPLTDFMADAHREQLFLFQDENAAMWPKSEPHDLLKTGPHMRPNNGPDTWPKTGPHTGPKVGHFNKHINNSKRGGENRLPPPTKKNKTENLPHDPDAPGAENAPGAARILPTLSEVQEFFNAHTYPEMEADKFFHHYQANGWRQGSKTLITDWQAAAHKWILNIHPSKPEHHDQHTRPSTGAGRLHTNENKSYSDPL
ncbi:hypothetical protein [Chitinophaga flava]|uniref:Uncharacterized protein n=1 Tax=Chitinophaga flava TaxID=2259036 RepID=A0A365XW71_9BACT|nr:hypothetical protein [Chitinophaga flava]RBL90450.1 hypothetical protein DF182_28740 [Chitinophaga flava]